MKHTAERYAQDISYKHYEILKGVLSSYDNQFIVDEAVQHALVDVENSIDLLRQIRKEHLGGRIPEIDFFQEVQQILLNR